MFVGMPAAWSAAFPQQRNGRVVRTSLRRDDVNPSDERAYVSMICMFIARYAKDKRCLFIEP
jgi:hypothetical protein